MIKNIPKQAILKRVITAIVLLLVVFIMINSSAYYFHSLMALTIAISSWEWSGFCCNRKRWRLAYSVLMVSLFWLMIDEQFINIMSIIAGGLWVLGFLRLYSFNGYRQYPISILISGVVLLLGFALSIVGLYQQSLDSLLVLLAIVVAVDMLGFVGGKKYGKTPLSSKISPNKTWEGLYAGLAGSLVLSVLFYIVYDVPFLKIIAICTIGALVSVLGDLFISCYKREAGIKDTGNLLPGHGGLLDRIDGLIALSPVFWVLVAWGDITFQI